MEPNVISPANNLAMRNNNRAGISRHAFTLIELVAVIVIVALMSGIVVYSVRGHIDAAALEGAVQRFQSLDQRLRSEAKRFEQPAEVLIGRRGTELTVRSSIDLKSTGISRNGTLGSRVTLDSLIEGRRATSSNRITFNSAGRTPNYAAKFVTANNAVAWLVVLGTSGQQIRCQSEEEVYAFLRP